MKRFMPLFVVLAILVLPLTPQLPGFWIATSAKSGRLVDAATGEGISNASVISSAKVYGSGGAGNIFRSIAVTDRDGRFYFPSTRWEAIKHFAIWIPGSHIRWFVTAFVPGYAAEGDEVTWANLDERGIPKFWPSSATNTPSFRWYGFVTDVVMPDMRAVNLTLREEIIYGSFMLKAGGWREGLLTADEFELHKRASTWLLPQICNLDTKQQIDIYQVTSLEAWVFNPAKFSETLFQLEPLKGKDERDGAWRATNVCTALRAGFT